MLRSTHPITTVLLETLCKIDMKMNKLVSHRRDLFTIDVAH